MQHILRCIALTQGDGSSPSDTDVHRVSDSSNLIGHLVEAGRDNPLVFVAGLVVLLVLLSAAMLWIGRRRSLEKCRSWNIIAHHLRYPIIATLTIIALRVITPLLLPAGDVPVSINRTLAVLTIVAFTWILVRLVDGVEETLVQRFDTTVTDNLRARTVHTQSRVLSRAVQVVLIVLGIGAALMTFPQIRQVGATLLASAGIAGLVAGFAARPLLENLIASVQIALTQPIRIDDVVIVEGEWGWIEEISSTFVIVKIWDERRLVVPLTYFLNNPIQNWTRKSSRLLGTVLLYCDYGVDVDGVRAELTRLCKANEYWDGRVAVVQVTDATDKSMELRALVSASTSPRLWELRVAIREGLIAYLKGQGEHVLPRLRADVSTEWLEPSKREEGS